MVRIRVKNKTKQENPSIIKLNGSEQGSVTITKDPKVQQSTFP
jgi:hypothetical protein